MDDSKILTLLWQRSEAAIEAMVRRYGQRLLRTAMNILGSSRDAEETVNDTYLAVWNAVPPKKPDPLAAFIYKTGRNTALNRLRANRAQKRAGDYDLSLEELAGCIPGPALEEQVEARELGRCIDAWLDTQNSRSRGIFLRRYWYGDQVTDIARDFGMQPNAVSVRLSRLRDGLREHLIQEGYYEA